MNERIRELSYEAQRYALNNTTGPDLAGLNELWQEKFAELIVKECYEHCKDQLMDRKTAEEAGLTYNDGVMDCAIGLLQHFGVEE